MCISNPMATPSASTGTQADTGPIKSKYALPPELIEQEKKKKRKQKSLVNFDGGTSTASGSGLGTGTGALGMDLG